MRSKIDHRAELASTVLGLVCAASAGAHAGLVPAHLESEPRLGVAFLVAVVLLLSAVVAVARRPADPAIAGGVMLLLGGLVLAYVASRTSGILVLDPHPEAVDPVGVATTIVEAMGLVSALFLMQPLGRRRPIDTQEVSR